MIIHNKEFYGIWWLGVASFKSAWMQKWLKFRQPLPSSAENPATSPLNMKHWQHPPAYLSYQWRALPGVDDKDGRMKRWPKRDAAIEDRIWEFARQRQSHDQASGAVVSYGSRRLIYRAGLTLIGLIPSGIGKFGHDELDLHLVFFLQASMEITAR